jgi:hypothetical protein
MCHLIYLIDERLRVGVIKCVFSIAAGAPFRVGKPAFVVFLICLGFMSRRSLSLPLCHPNGNTDAPIRGVFFLNGRFDALPHA